ncbi:MAG: ribonuclease J [Deltaproteobacteria bacterium]|nr:MAG: ribonuclease J [Deltaproteobacteria bacterium]
MKGKKSDSIRILPFGGLGEIGLNMMMIEYGEARIFIDTGLMFPDRKVLGVDLAIPNIAWLAENPGKNLGILYTHGHEDHIGALPYLYPRIAAPVYGTPLTVAFLEQRLREFGLDRTVEMHVVKGRERVELGPFRVEFIETTHSISDGMALAIETPIGTILHTGDFKFDAAPTVGSKTDFYRLACYGEEGVLALLSDSTNAERKGFTPSEAAVRQELDATIRNCSSRIIFGVFASSIHRIQQIFDLSRKYGRKVLLSGRSMLENVRIARKLGILAAPDDLFIEPSELPYLPRNEITILTTGSQGEPMSALARMAAGTHRQLGIEAGDTIVFSSKAIPGNEKAISFLINRFFRLGAEVIHEKIADVHTSGHASQEELKLMMQLTRPKFFMPVHGETRHLVRHIGLAHEVGIPEERTILAHDGDLIEISRQTWRRIQQIDTTPIYIDGTSMNDVAEMVLRDRQLLAKDGLVILTMAIERKSGELLIGPEFHSRGFLEDGEDLFERLQRELTSFISGEAAREMDLDMLVEEVRRKARRFFKREVDRKPVVLPIILEV